MRLLLACALLAIATAARAQTTTTTTTTLPTFPTVEQGTDAKTGRFHIMSGQSCPDSVTCEAPMLHVMASDTAVLLVDCAGTCRVKLFCRPPGFRHDTLIADTTSMTDQSSVTPLTSACPWVVPKITACTSGSCTVDAWLLEINGNW